MAKLRKPNVPFEDLRIELPAYVKADGSSASQPFSLSSHDLFRRETLRSSGEGEGARTDYFKHNLVRIRNQIGRPVPYRFTDSIGRKRSMDGGCLKFVGPDGQNVAEFVMAGDYIVAVEPKPILLAAYSEIGSLAWDVQQLADDKELAATTRQQLIDARIGQGQFRAEVLAKWNSRCAVSACGLEPVLRASHIKPWRISSNRERLDADNGLPLTANIDALFDCGLISFDNDGRVLFSARLPIELHGLIPTPRRLSNRLAPRAQSYMAEHRKANGFE